MMNLKPQKCLYLLFLIWILGQGSAALAKNDPQIESLFNKAISHSPFHRSQLGIHVANESLDGEKVIYQLNADRPMVPASVTKILTAGAVFDDFPPNSTFKTQLLADSPVSDGHLQGPLYLKGGGDPSFVSESMWLLVNNFYRRDIREIDGDIVVDDSLFDEDLIDKSREAERVDRAYDAPVCAMSFNWNSVNVYVSPGSKVGASAVVKADPVNTYIEILNRAKTSRHGDDIRVSRVPDGNHDRIMVAGSIGMDQPERAIFKNVRRPALWAGINLVEFLKERGISVKGQVRKGKTPANARVLAEHESPPIHVIITDMAKFSNNFVAEMLTKDLAVANGHTPGNIKDGIEIIRKFLDKVGIDRSRYTLVNPAGFTLDNRIEPQDLSRVLNYLHQQFSYFPEFLTALPIAGVDGTLKHRMRNSSADLSVRAKTGLLNGVVGLAGYAARKNGTLRSFVFLYNGRGHEAEARQLFDNLAAILAK